MPAAKPKSKGSKRPAARPSSKRTTEPKPERVAAKARKAAPGGGLLGSLAVRLGVDEAAVVARALRELADRLGPVEEKAPAAAPAPTIAPTRRKVTTAEETVIAGVPHGGTSPSTTVDQQLGHAGGLPKRLFVLLHGRGLDGAGRPVEVINFPCVIGSARANDIWLNAPNVETRHVRISETGEGWVLEDLATQRGTFLADGARVTRRVLQKGDAFLLAGHERMGIDIR